MKTTLVLNPRKYIWFHSAELHLQLAPGPDLVREDINELFIIFIYFNFTLESIKHAHAL